MLGMGHSHASRVLKLLESARQAIAENGWQPLQGPIGLEVTLLHHQTWTLGTLQIISWALPTYLKSRIDAACLSIAGH